MKLLLATALFFWLSNPVFAQNEATDFGTRAPMQCEQVKSKTVPSIDQITKLVQCNTEKNFGSSIELMTDIKVQVGGPTAWNAADSNLTVDADQHLQVYPIRGSFTDVSCMKQFAWSSFRGKNCTVQPILEDHGLCWRTTFGDWRCGFGGRDIRSGARQTGMAPPSAVASRK